MKGVWAYGTVKTNFAPMPWLRSTQMRPPKYSMICRQIGSPRPVLTGLLVAVASGFLLLNGFVQYFAKLHEAVHWGLLAVGFGVALLGLAILYEKKVKHLLPKLKQWA